jgi:hypothetical protein
MKSFAIHSQARYEICMGKIKFGGALLLSLFAVGGTSEAAVYRYSGTMLICGFSATRQEAGVPVRKIGSHQLYFSYQLFSSDEDSAPRFTSYNESEKSENSMAYLTKGGIPNLLATKNWTVVDNTQKVSSFLALPKSGIKIPVEATYFTTSRPSWSTVMLQLQKPMTLQTYHDILLALGEHGVPDFNTDAPKVKWAAGTGGDPYELKLQVTSQVLDWRIYPDRLFRYLGGEWIKAIHRVQLHYPLEKFNGLSYHVDIFCDPRADH